MISLQISESVLASVDPVILEAAGLEEAASKALQQFEAPEGDLSIIITDDDQMHQLNREYLGIDSPTDVLSFPAGYMDPDSQSAYLGDVLISYPRAVEQASAGGHPVEQELQLLVVHAVLHLLGYDHMEEEEKARMWEAQGQVLQNLNNPLSPP